MSTLEIRIQNTFDSLTLPPDLKMATLARIEQEALQRNDEGYFALVDGQELDSRIASDASQPRGSSTKADRTAEELMTPELSSLGQAAEDSAPFSKTEQLSVGGGLKSGAQRRRRSSSRFVKRLSFALAACLVCVALGFGGYGVYATETAFVGIEINPSLELGVNRFDRVVSARALNEDGQVLLDNSSVVGKSYEEALSSITSSSVFASYVQEDSLLDISVTCKNDEQAAALMQQSDTNIQSLPVNGSCHRATQESYDEAQQAGMGVARYEAAQELMRLDSSVSLDDCKSMSMRTLCNHILEIDPENEYAHSHGHGSSQGQGQSQGLEGQGQGQAHGQQGHQGQGQGLGRSQGVNTSVSLTQQSLDATTNSDAASAPGASGTAGQAYGSDASNNYTGAHHPEHGHGNQH